MDQVHAIPIVDKLKSTISWLDQSPLSVDYARSMNNVLMAFSKLSDGDVAVVDQICTSGVVPRLVSILKDTSPAGLDRAHAIRTLSNITAGTESQAQIVIDNGMLCLLPGLLKDDVEDVRKYSALICCNIAAGSTEQIDALIKSERILESLVFCGMEDIWSIRQDATWALANLCLGNGCKYIPKLVDADGLGPLVMFLSTPQVGEEFLLDILEALLNVLQVHVSFRLKIEEFKGLDDLDNLANKFAGEPIGQKAAAVLRYFDNDSEVEGDENLAPATEGNTFVFRMGKPSVASDEQPFLAFGDID